MSDNQEERKDDTEIGKSSLPRPEAEDIVESGPSQEEKDSDSKQAIQVDPHTSDVPSTSQHGSSSALTQIPKLLHLIVFSANGVSSAIPDPAQEDLHRVASEPNIAENRSNWKSTAAASAKLILRAVKDSADAFGPLKSVAGGLIFILEGAEV